MPENNIMTIHVGPTGRKVFTDNLEMNQNSSNNVLELFCEAKYEFVQVFYTFPDGKTTYKHHMIPGGFDKDKSAYKFHDKIDKAVTSFVIPNVTANLKVSFIGYYKNDLNQYTPVGINDFLITVIRVNNNEVYDQTYNGSDVVNIWKNINNLNAILVDLNPDYKPTTLENLQAKVDENYNELNTRLNSVPNIDDVYNKETINQMFGTVYKYGGSVDNFSDLPTNYTNEQTGVVINVRNPNGMNYVWTGSEWDALGGFDETKYYDKEYIDEAIRVTQLKAKDDTTAVDNKVNALSATHSSDISTLRNNITQINTQFDNYYNKEYIDSTIRATQLKAQNETAAVDNRVNTLEATHSSDTSALRNDITQINAQFADYYNKSEIDGKVSGVFKFMGSKDTLEDLPQTGNIVGDVWNVVADNNNNYVWTSDNKWESLGPIVNLSNFYTKEVMDQKLSVLVKADSVYTKAQSYNRTEIDDKINNVKQTVSLNQTELSNLENRFDTHTTDFTTFKTSTNNTLERIEREYKAADETLNTAITNKQDTLVSGTNIKTVNGVSILGTGNIAISGGVGIDDNTISTSSTYSSSKIDSTYLKAPEGRLDIENGRVNLKNNINSVYSITNNEVVMELNDDGLRYHDNATNREVNITPYYGAIDQNADPATIKVNGIGLARETDLNKKVSLRGDTMTGNLNAPAFTVDSTKVASGDKPLIDGAINFKYKNTNDEASNAWLTMLPSGQLQFGSQGAAASEIGTVATQEWVNKKITNAYIYKGSVDTYDALPSGAEPGFVYNVRSNGANYAWTGTEWDELGATVNLDAYALKTDLNGKQDKLVSGTNIKTINGESILGAGDITIIGDSVGYYDTITKNSDGTYTITRQTGYLTINAEDITSGSNETVNKSNAYVYVYNNNKISDAFYEWEAIIGISNNGFEVKCVDAAWVKANKISINSTQKKICLGFETAKTQAEIQALCPIYIQYKLATATTEKVEVNHYARYNERFILEHNKSEAERSANLLNIDDVKSKTINGITYSIKDGVITLNGTATDNVLIKAFCDIKANQSYYLKIFDSPIKLRCYYSNDVNTPFGTLVMHAKEKLFTPTTDVKCLNIWIWKDDTINSNIKPMLVEGSTSPITYQPYNKNKHITNNEAEFLKTESDRSANLFDINTVTIGNGYDYTATASDWVKAIDIPVEPNTTYTASSIIGKYAFNHGDIVSDYNKNTITTSSDITTLSLFMYVGDYSGTARAWFSNYMLNKGPVALPYQPYEGKVIHEKDLKNASTNLGYYDTITENADGTYTITKQTGYIKGTDFLYWGINGAGNRYVTFDHIKVNRNIENVIGNCSRVGSLSWWQSTFSQVTITYDENNDFLIILLPYGTAENDSSPLNDIHIQYKLPNARTEIVEKNYCAQYNKRFILEHNKIEAEKSSNLWSYENSITINAGSEKWWYLSNEIMDAWGLVIGETYSIKSFVNNDTRNLSFQLLPSYSDFRDGRTFVFTSDTQIRIGGNTVSSTVTFTPKIMLVKGIDIADEYQPYSGKPVHKKEFEDFKNSMKFIPYVSFAETGTSEDISENGTYFVIPTDPFSASLKLEVRAGASGTLQTAYFSGGIISVSSFFDSKLNFFEIRITYGAGSSANSISIADGHNYTSPPSGVISRVTGKCKIYKLI